jgi:hypothetical protein
MSDSAEGSVSRPRDVTNVGAPAQATLEPEAAEEFASAFVPVWQYDDAPFSAGEELSAEALEELTADGDGSASDPGLAAAAAPTTDPFVRMRDENIRSEPSVVVSRDLVVDAPVHRALHQAVASPFAEPLVLLEEDDIFRSRPRKGLLIGIGVAAVLSILGIAFTRARAPSPVTLVAPTSQSTLAVPGPPIPPPPSLADTTAASTPSTGGPIPSTTTSAQSAQDAPSSAALPPLPPRRATAAQRPRPQESAHPQRNPAPPSKSAVKPGRGGLVRDNPF